MPGVSRPGKDTNLRQAARAFFQHQMFLKQLEIVEVNVVPMRNDFLPVLARRLVQWRRPQTKAFRLIIGAYEEAVVKMLDMILMLARARQKDLEFAERPVRFEVTVFLAVGVR